MTWYDLVLACIFSTAILLTVSFTAFKLLACGPARLVAPELHPLQGACASFCRRSLKYILSEVHIRPLSGKYVRTLAFNRTISTRMRHEAACLSA